MPPPPPPSSPPPGGSEESATASRSEKFKALQGILSSAPTMYSPPSESNRAAPPPSKRVHMETQGEDDPRSYESPKLKHTTKDRPKRKVRPPSRKVRSERYAEPPSTEEEEEEAPPDLPPPPPPLSDLPSEPLEGLKEASGQSDMNNKILQI